MERSSDDRLRLFDIHVTELLTESAGTAHWSVEFNVPSGIVTTTEPPREAFRSWLVAVRLLDAPREDIYLPDVITLIEAKSISDASRELVGMIRAKWQEAQTGLGIVLEDNDGPITPREAFELLAYVQHLHRNAAKEARVKAMAEPFWQMVRHEGVNYGSTIAAMSVALRSVARDDPATTHLFEPAPAGTPNAS